MTDEERKARARENYRKWREANPDKVKESARKYREKHREQYNAYQREYHRRPEARAKQTERNRKWNAANPDKAREAARIRSKRYALRKRVEKAIALLEEQGYKIIKEDTTVE